MNQITLENTLQTSQLILGCMRLAEKSIEEVVSVLTASKEVGITLYDHADIYAHGESERKFAQGLRLARIPREQIILQSKCGIARAGKQTYFDFSKQHILTSVEGSLKRLETDYLDILLLHRPDALMQPEEVAEAFEILHETGKVRYFGVSNQHPYQIELLKKYVSQPLLINQLQFGPAHTVMLDSSFNVNMQNQLSIPRDGNVLDYCRLKDMTVQAWSPFQVDLAQGLFMNHPNYQRLTATIQRLADEHGVSLEAMVLAWIFRHPAQMQAIVGSMNSERIEAMAQACTVQISRAEWYEIYTSAGNPLP